MPKGREKPKRNDDNIKDKFPKVTEIPPEQVDMRDSSTPDYKRRDRFGEALSDAERAHTEGMLTLEKYVEEESLDRVKSARKQKEIERTIGVYRRENNLHVLISAPDSQFKSPEEAKMVKEQAFKALVEMGDNGRGMLYLLKDKGGEYGRRAAQVISEEGYKRPDPKIEDGYYPDSAEERAERIRKAEEYNAEHADDTVGDDLLEWMGGPLTDLPDEKLALKVAEGGEEGEIAQQILDNREARRNKPGEKGQSERGKLFADTVDKKTGKSKRDKLVRTGKEGVTTVGKETERSTKGKSKKLDEVKFAAASDDAIEIRDAEEMDPLTGIDEEVKAPKKKKETRAEKPAKEKSKKERPARVAKRSAEKASKEPVGYEEFKEAVLDESRPMEDRKGYVEEMALTGGPEAKDVLIAAVESENKEIGDYAQEQWRAAQEGELVQWPGDIGESAGKEGLEDGPTVLASADEATAERLYTPSDMTPMDMDEENMSIPDETTAEKPKEEVKEKEEAPKVAQAESSDIPGVDLYNEFMEGFEPAKQPEASTEEAPAGEPIDLEALAAAGKKGLEFLGGANEAISIINEGNYYRLLEDHSDKIPMMVEKGVGKASKITGMIDYLGSQMWENPKALPVLEKIAATEGLNTRYKNPAENYVAAYKRREELEKQYSVDERNS